MSGLPAVAMGGVVTFLDGEAFTQRTGRVWSLAAGGGYWVIPADKPTEAVHVKWRTISRSGTPKHALGRKLHRVTS